MASGRLFLVGTPIGNLGDLTRRAETTLRSVARIAAEDTRRTRALLAHLGIQGKPLTSLDANASQQKLDAFLAHALAGEDVAFVTDAGMPAVSDPGAPLVRRATAQGLRVEVVPGPSAVTAAVALSGLVDAPYLFFGFLPRQGKKRRDAVSRIASSTEPVVLFEAGNRTAETLRDLAAAAPERDAVVCRELTKLHEETLRGRLDALAALEHEWRGEVVIVVAAAAASAAQGPSDAEIEARISEALASGKSVRDVVAELVDWSRLPKRELYARVQKLRGE